MYGFDTKRIGIAHPWVYPGTGVVPPVSGVLAAQWVMTAAQCSFRGLVGPGGTGGTGVEVELEQGSPEAELFRGDETPVTVRGTTLQHPSDRAARLGGRVGSAEANPARVASYRDPSRVLPTCPAHSEQ